VKFSQTAYQQPTPEFYPGDRVKWLENEVIYTVIRGTHTHTQLEGLPFAIANWRLKLSYRKRQEKSSVITDTGEVSVNQQPLRISADLLNDRKKTKISPNITTTAKEDFEGRKP